MAVKKHIVILDGVWGGHHEMYIKYYSKALIELGYKVSILCPFPAEVKKWLQENLEKEYKTFDCMYFVTEEINGSCLFPSHSYLTALFRVFNNWLHIHQVFKKQVFPLGKPDHYLFLWLDAYLHGYLPSIMVDYLLPNAWSGLYFHPTHYRGFEKSSKLKRTFFRFPENMIKSSKYMKSLAVLDDGVVTKFRATLKNKINIFVMPDFTDEEPHNKNFTLCGLVKPLSKGRKTVLLIGSLAKRKGLLTLLKVAQKPSAKDFYFVVVGELVESTYTKDELKQLKLASESGIENCYFHFKYVTNNADFNALVDMSDLIYAVYEGFLHSSNLVTKAAMYNKKLIVCSGGYMEEVVKKYQLGAAVTPQDVNASLVAIKNVLLSKADKFPVSAGREVFLVNQTQKKLKSELVKLIN